ncbi:hypothetical protein DSO57_1017056 [Entomophthora muscae]|uniref:Uncharacterized protein n=1 Tax=Entomophthora muscae TaxID=34485 RepID=A0ACC2T4L4_9FUNG|nr:hypothetical protein DSO57_1017056 [Entomophthora muscae]
MSSTETPPALRSTISSKHDVDEFLNSLGVNPKSLPLEDKESTTELNAGVASKHEDILSFLNEPSTGKTQDISNEEPPKSNSKSRELAEMKSETPVSKKPEMKGMSEDSEEKAPETASLIEKKEEKESENEVDSGWSFGGFWNSASSALKNTPKSEYLLSNVASVKTALTGLSETVRSNENAQYFGSAVKDFVTSDNINKIGSNLKTFTQQSVASVLTKLQGPDIHQTLKVYLLTGQNFSEVESLSYQLLDPLMSEDLLFQDVFFLDGQEILETFSPEKAKEVLNFKTSQGFTDGFNEAKAKAQALFEAHNTYEAQKEQEKKQPKEEILSQLENQVLTPTTSVNIFVVCQPCRAAPLPDSASFFYCLTLLSPRHPNAIYKTFSQPLPACTNLSSRSQTQSEKPNSVDDEHRILSLRSIQLALHFLLIDFFEGETKLRKVEEEKALQESTEAK